MRTRWLGRSVLLDGGWWTAYEITGHPILLTAKKGKYLYWGFDYVDPDTFNPTTKRTIYMRVKNVSGKTVQAGPMGGMAKTDPPGWFFGS